MPSFTSTTLLSLVVGAIEAIDPDLSAGARRPDPMQVGISPDTDKTAILTGFVERHGVSAVLQIGMQYELAEESPVASVLARSTHPSVLAEKWMRLERYYHSSHRTLIETDQPGSWHCHRSSAETPSTPAENHLIAGVLFGLLHRIGVSGCRLLIDGQDLGAADLATADVDGPGAHFSLHWSREAPASDHDLAPFGAINDRLADLLASDIGRSWKLRDAARELAFSERSLQRQLGLTERSFSSVLRRARMREATRLLTDTGTSLAEIGYCCGYADQAHFQRDFLRVANMTPKTFRKMSRDSGAILQ